MTARPLRWCLASAADADFGPSSSGHRHPGREPAGRPDRVGLDEGQAVAPTHPLRAAKDCAAAPSPYSLAEAGCKGGELAVDRPDLITLTAKACSRAAPTNCRDNIAMPGSSPEAAQARKDALHSFSCLVPIRSFTISPLCGILPRPCSV